MILLLAAVTVLWPPHTYTIKGKARDSTQYTVVQAQASHGEPGDVCGEGGDQPGIVCGEGGEEE